MGIQDWLMMIGLGLVYILILIAVVWLVFRRVSVKSKRHKSHNKPDETDSEN